MESLELYVVRNKDGRYLRSKGYGGYGQSWVTELKKAKVYTKKGPACAQVTWWANNYPDFGIPDLIPLTLTMGDPIDQTKRVLYAQYMKELSITRKELARAREDYEKAKSIYEQLQNGDVSKGLKIREQQLKDWEDKLKELTKDGLWKG
jgi:hypothetical protein